MKRPSKAARDQSPVDKAAKRPATANMTHKVWNAFVGRKPLAYTIEARLYTDARVGGEVVLGPYSFLNTCASAMANLPPPRPALVLRVALHGEQERPTLDWRSDSRHYHGGDFVDEMAALTSLFLGRRMSAGPIDREFNEPRRDPLGNPLQIQSKRVPILPPAAGGMRVPRLLDPCNLDDLRPLADFAERNVAEANALVKAARLYQQAMWICDSDPALAWLLLVSAVETPAEVWFRREVPPIEMLKDAHPGLYEAIENSQASDLLTPVAKVLAEFTGATRKFREFLLAFCPHEPLERPTEFLQLSFDPKDLKKVFNVVYRHRSLSLHSGVAFPMPMCEAPGRIVADTGPYQEIPASQGVQAQGASWLRKDTPMLLHTFEYLARGALLNWWKSLGEAAVPPGSNGQD